MKNNIEKRLNDLVRKKGFFEAKMQGRELEIECPVCKEKIKSILLKGSILNCPKCNSDIDVRFNVK